MSTKLRGLWGEARALEYMKSKDYDEVASRYTTRYGELDLIVRDAEYIVFVEVKLRKNSDFAEAREFVGAKKQERLRKAALMWLSDNETELQPRFDVIEIYAPDGVRTKNPEIIHIEDAF